MRKAFVVATCAMILSASRAFCADGAPPGWQLEGHAIDFFEVGTEQADGVTNGKVAFIRSKSMEKAADAAAVLLQRVEAASYVGKRLRLSTRLKTQDVDAARCFMTITGGGKTLHSFYLANPIAGTTPWQDYNIVLDVPANADRVTFGFFLLRKGEVWADGFKLEPVGQDVPLSVQPLPRAPVNLNFDP